MLAGAGADKNVRAPDNSAQGKNMFGSIPKLVEKLENKTLSQLETEGVFVFPELLLDADDLLKDQIVLRSVNNEYRTGNVMGFLGLGKERLVIHSRFNSDEQDFFFLYLLEKVLEIPNLLELSINANLEERAFDLLAFMFPYQLKKAMRKGLFKAYIRKDYNDSNVKGTIDFAEHLKKNVPFLGKIAYSQREFSYDNELTQLIRHSQETINSRSYGSRLLRAAKDEISFITQSTQSYRPGDKIKIINANIKKPLNHAYYHEYRSLQRLCLMILRNERHQVNSGYEKMTGLLFDGSWLWEEYVNSIIGSLFFHPENKGGKGAQQLFDREIGRKIGLIYPDFISKNTSNRIILDAKYKPSGNIGNRDYLQVLAYMFRFDSKRGYYLYPEVDGASSANEEFFLNSGSSYENNVSRREDVSVNKYGFLIPNETDSYGAFKAQMEKSEKVLFDILSHQTDNL